MDIRPVGFPTPPGISAEIMTWKKGGEEKARKKVVIWAPNDQQPCDICLHMAPPPTQPVIVTDMGLQMAHSTCDNCKSPTTPTPTLLPGDATYEEIRWAIKEQTEEYYRGYRREHGDMRERLIGDILAAKTDPDLPETVTYRNEYLNAEASADDGKAVHVNEREIFPERKKTYYLTDLERLWPKTITQSVRKRLIDPGHIPDPDIRGQKFFWTPRQWAKILVHWRENTISTHRLREAAARDAQLSQNDLCSMTGHSPQTFSLWYREGKICQSRTVGGWRSTWSAREALDAFLAGTVGRVVQWGLDERFYVQERRPRG